MNNKINDERITITQNKIRSEAYSIVMFFLLISSLVQQFLNLPKEQYIVELLVFIGGGLYLIVRNINLGIDIYNSKPVNYFKIFLTTFLSAFIAIGILVFFFNERDTSQLITFFMTFVSMFFIFSVVMRKILEKKIDNINKELDDE